MSYTSMTIERLLEPAILMQRSALLTLKRASPSQREKAAFTNWPEPIRPAQG